MIYRLPSVETDFLLHAPLSAECKCSCQNGGPVLCVLKEFVKRIVIVDFVVKLFAND